MVEYSRHTLANGLRVLLHRDTTTPLVTVNVLYLVGSRDERPERTGFAHLFEHLMFGGTPRYPDFDAVVDSIAGESNAFTTCDYTNYYMTFPADGLPTALALEADRMATSGFSKEVLEVQKRVVTEEYHQRYMNQPYGDVYLLLRPLCYRQYPYRWATIGADIRHVQEATMEEVQDFFGRYYRPDNAILCVAGNIDEAETLRMVEKAFGTAGVRADNIGIRHYPEEPEQTAPRMLEVRRDVPNDAFYMAWVMSDRYTPDPVSGRPLYYAFDALSDVLATGHSSRLYRRMVQDEALLTEVNAFITGDMGPGLFVVTGKLRAGVDFATAEAAVREELDRLAAEPLPDREVEKVANHYENTFVYSQYKASDRAYSLCYYEMMGDVAQVNSEPEHYRALRPDDLQRVAARLTPERGSTLRIRKLKIE